MAFALIFAGLLTALCLLSTAFSFGVRIGRNDRELDVQIAQNKAHRAEQDAADRLGEAFERGFNSASRVQITHVSQVKPIYPMGVRPHLKSIDGGDAA